MFSRDDALGCRWKKRKGQQQTQEEEERRNLLCAVHGRGGCRWLWLVPFYFLFSFFFKSSTWSFSFFLFPTRLGLYSPVFLSISAIFIFSCLVRELYRDPHNNNSNTGVNPPNNIYRRINMDIYALTIKTGDRSIDFLYRVLHPATKYVHGRQINSPSSMMGTPIIKPLTAICQRSREKSDPESI